MESQCTCGHLERWHDPSEGTCDFLYCDCVSFTELVGQRSEQSAPGVSEGPTGARPARPHGR